VAKAISVDAFVPFNIVNNFSNIEDLARVFEFDEFHAFTVVPPFPVGTTFKVDLLPDDNSAFRFWNRPIVPFGPFSLMGIAESVRSSSFFICISISLKPIRFDLTVMLRWVLSLRMSMAFVWETCLKL
jgi:hypothetical protein